MISILLTIASVLIDAISFLLRILIGLIIRFFIVLARIIALLFKNKKINDVRKEDL
jgi:uncharacterized integral membrane protein